MTQQELEQYKSEFKTIVFLKGLITSRKKSVAQLTAFDKNDSHKQAIINAIGYLNDARNDYKEALKGREYNHMMLSLRKATLLHKQVNKSSVHAKRFEDFNPFETNKLNNEQQ